MMPLRGKESSERGPIGECARGRVGVTLVELMVVLTILGIIAGVVGLSISRRPAPLAADDISLAQDSIAAARRAAVATGRQVVVNLLVTVTDGGSTGPRMYHVTALPDGSVIADAGLGIDRLTGRPIGLSHTRGRE